MAAKKRTRRKPKASTLEVPAPSQVPVLNLHEPRANFGANETRKPCPVCSSLSSTVSKSKKTIFTGPDRTLTRRQRLCNGCQKTWSTVDLLIH